MVFESAIFKIIKMFYKVMMISFYEVGLKNSVDPFKSSLKN